MEVLMDKHGTAISDFKQATELTSSEQVGALCDGKVDAIGYTVGAVSYTHLTLPTKA